MEGDRVRPPVRRDDRHRHQPARPACRGSRCARRPRPSTRCTATSPAPTRIIALNADAARALPCACGERCRRSATAWPIRPGFAWAAITASTSSAPACRSTAACRGDEAAWQHPPGRARRGPDRPAPNDPRGRDLRLWRDLHRGGRYRGRDPQHRLCRRLSARLLVARLGLRRRICAAGARARVDGPDRHRLRRRARAQGRRLGRDRLRLADRVAAVGAFAVRAVDDARVRGSSGAWR